MVQVEKGEEYIYNSGTVTGLRTASPWVTLINQGGEFSEFPRFSFHLRGFIFPFRDSEKGALLWLLTLT